jgi:hypothetical protein
MQRKYSRACRFPCGRGFLHKPLLLRLIREGPRSAACVFEECSTPKPEKCGGGDPSLCTINLPFLPRTPQRTFQAVFASQSASILLGELMHKSQRRKDSSYAGVYEGARPGVTSLRIFWWLQTNVPPIRRVLRFKYSSPCQRRLRMISVTGKPRGKYGSPKEPLEWLGEKREN